MGCNGVVIQSKPGLREQNKADKLRRIKAAARLLFLKKGYEATTTREIAALAHVSVGTVFAYAQDKAELVCLMAIDRLENEFARAFQECRPGKPLLQQLLSVYAHMFRDAAKNVPLSRILIKEFMGYGGRQRIDRRIESRIKVLLLAAVEAGEVALHEDPAYVARILNLSYLAEMRYWIMSDNPKPSAGIKNLRRTFTWLLRSPA